MGQCVYRLKSWSGGGTGTRDKGTHGDSTPQKRKSETDINKVSLTHLI